MLNVTVVIPDNNTGTRLCEYISNKYGVKAKATLWRDIQGIEKAGADAFIIYRKSIENMRALERVQGKVALLYGSTPIPQGDRDVTYTKLTGTLPGCINDFMEQLLGQSFQVNDLTWGGESDESANLWSPVRSVALFSPGGGVGKTTTAVHLAKLAEQAHIDVGIVETDEDKGGVLRYLGKQPAQEGLDSLGKAEWDNEELFKESVERLVQKVGRIQVVPMVGTFNGLVCDVKNVSSLHRWVESRFSLTLYDLPPRLRDVMTYSVLQEADLVILVAEPTDVLMDALQKHMRLCQEVDKFRDLPQKYRLLVNKVPEKEGLKPEEMAAALGLPLLGVIPADMEHYDKIINRARFEIPADSPWRLIYENAGLQGSKSVLPINSMNHSGKSQKNIPAKSKERKNRLFGFFFGS